MVMTSRVIYEGQKTIQLENEQLSLWITTDLGPRILGLSFRGGANLMAVLPEAVIPVNGAADYLLRGGHRLWYAPENPLTTYLPDDQPVKTLVLENGVEVVQPIDQKTGIQKSWRMVLDETAPKLTIDHRLMNLGRGDFELAPWAITMLRPGGVGLIPLSTDTDDEHGLLPNRQIVFWPYTDLKSPHMNLGNQGIAVQAVMEQGALKVGAPNPLGWLAYQLESLLFVKRAEYQPGGHYLDRGASSQIYCNPDVIELETLGPVVNLAPGEMTEHREVWQLYGEGDWPGDIKLLFESETFS